MDIEQIILDTLREKKELKAADIIKITGFSRAYVNRFFQKLRDRGKIILIGKANRACYVLAEKQRVIKAKEAVLNVTKILKNINLFEDVVLADIKKNSGIFSGICGNLSDILDYAFSEMLNNAIEHSKSETIKINMRRDEEHVSFEIIDIGVGIFNNIMKKRRLNTELEAIQDLLKGKQTTAPHDHSGEGIFFTSKTADFFLIQSSKKKLIFDNLLEDVFIKDTKDIAGTKVTFSINCCSKKHLSDVFKQYTDSSFEFNKTQVMVKMYTLGLQHVSRSQARRITAGLEKFKTIILDFKTVDTIGQGFADEIFRVWKLKHPGISIDSINANENVEFMIKRSKIKAEM